MKIAEIRFEEYENIIDLLCERTFFGLETKPDNFIFLYEGTKTPIIKKHAQRIAKESGIKKFKINPPFHSFPDISK